MQESVLPITALRSIATAMLQDCKVLYEDRGKTLVALRLLNRFTRADPILKTLVETGKRMLTYYIYITGGCIKSVFFRQRGHTGRLCSRTVIGHYTGSEVLSLLGPCKELHIKRWIAPQHSVTLGIHSTIYKLRYNEKWLDLEYDCIGSEK